MTVVAELVRTGVTLAIAGPVPADLIPATVRRVAERLNAGYEPGALGESLATLGFDLGDEMSAVVVRAMTAETIAERPELATLLEVVPALIVRLEMVTRPEDRTAPMRADHATVALVVAFAETVNLVAIDGVGAIYDLDELRILDARGLGRFESDAFLVAAAERDEDLAAAEHSAAASAVAPTSAPVDLVLPLVGPRVPALTWIAALGDTPAGIMAPALDDLDAALLARAGIPFSRIGDLPVARDAIVDDRARDEVDVHSSIAISRDAAAQIVESVTLEWVSGAAAREGADAPSMTSISSAVAADGVALPVAEATFGNALCSIALIDVTSAAARLGSVLTARGDVNALLGAIPSTIVTIELVSADPVDEVGMRRADAFSVAVAAAFAERYATVAVDLAGGIYVPETIQRLAARRATRDGSWIARVASARSAQ